MILRPALAASLLAASVSLLPAKALAADAALAEAPVAAAAVETYPYVEGTLDLELGNDWVFRADDPGAEQNDLYFEGELGLRFGLTPVFAVNLGLTAEAVRDIEPFSDRTFGDIGLYVDTLNLEAALGQATVLAGKFGPSFGTAWDITPGLYGTDFAEDYELSEQVGFGAAYAFDAGKAGTHTLGGAVFFADTTVLSDSVFTRRGRLSVDDGGVGNTERLDNLALSLDGADIAALPGFSYNLGYRHLSAGVSENADEDGFVFGLARETELANGVVLGLTGEIAYFSNAAGVSGDDATYGTAGLSLARGPWHGEVAGAVRKLDFDAGGSLDDRLVQVSAGYTFENGFDLSAGYARVRVEDLDYDVFGLRLAKSLDFSTRD